MMHSFQYKQNLTGLTPASSINGVMASGVAGALITGAMAAASELRETAGNKEKRREAIGAVAKEGFGGGLAVAAGVAVGKTLFRSNILGLLAMFAVSAGVKYAYDGLTSAGKTEAEPVPAVPDKGAKAK